MWRLIGSFRSYFYRITGFWIVKAGKVPMEKIRLNGTHIIGLREIPTALMALYSARLINAYRAGRRRGCREALKELFGDPVSASLEASLLEQRRLRSAHFYHDHEHVNPNDFTSFLGLPDHRI